MSHFKIINQQTSQSFKQQKNFIKGVLVGKYTDCPECGKNITLILPEDNKTEKNPGIYCLKGCTDIELDMQP